MPAPNHPTPTQWVAHVAHWRTSGLTRSGYCEKHNLKLHCLIYWIKRSKSQPAQTNAALTLVQAKIKPTSQKAETSLILECRNGGKLIIPVTTPAAWLGELLRALV